MSLSHELISQFAKIVKEDKKQSSESTLYGTVVSDGNGNKYVKLDGSDQLTPLSDDERPSADTTTSSANEGERVSVLIKDHTATVTGNISSPAVRTGDFNDLNDQVTDIKKFDIVIAEQVQANEAYIKKLQSDKAEIGDLTAATARITELETKKANVEDLTAAKAEITDLKTTKIDAEVANAKFATIGNLDATNATVNNLQANYAEFETVTTNKFEAIDASINDLDTKKLSAEQAELKYANVDFTNITKAAVEKLFTESGIIKDLIVSEGHITGELVGVTIKGDIIEGGTVKADKLVVKGSDGLFYKLNTDGVTTTAEQTEYNSLNGSVITAKSITAEKIMVDDLVAFGATIGGINISNSSLYSGVKSSADNTTRGFYLDKDGQLVVGDATNFFKYYKDQNGEYKLEISASNISIYSGDTIKNVKTAIEDIETKTAAVETRVTSAETAINQNKEAISLRATKTEVADVKNQIISRGENLVTNGTAMLGTNYNFSDFTYDGSDAYYSGGSFKYSWTGAVSYRQRAIDELMPVNVGDAYELSYWIKANNADVSFWDMLTMYDIDENIITSDYVMWIDGSTTTLAQELKNGDTVIYLTSAAGFNTTTTNDYQRGLIFWNYTNSKGYTYPTETYSRNRWESLWSSGSVINKTNNTITLSSAWTHGTFPAGTSVSQCSSGTTYTYLNDTFKLPVNTWTYKSGIVQDIGRNGEANKFREGTAFIGIRWMFWYGGTESCNFRLSNVSLTQNAGINKIDELRTDTAIANKTVIDRVSTIETNANSINASVISLETKIDNNQKNNEARISDLENKASLIITEEQVNVQIESKLQNGVDKVETSTGFRFDEDGLNITSSKSNTNTQIDESGMIVRQTTVNGDQVNMLVADKDGVNARNLQATTYLIVGQRSRFEDYGDDRTGCFWIGG